MKRNVQNHDFFETEDEEKIIEEVVCSNMWLTEKK